MRGFHRRERRRRSSVANFDAFGFLLRNDDDERMLGPARLDRLGLDRNGERVGGFEGSLSAGRAHAEALSRDLDLDMFGIHVRHGDAHLVAIRMVEHLRVFKFIALRDATPARDQHLIEKFVECSFEIKNAYSRTPCHQSKIPRAILMRHPYAGRDLVPRAKFRLLHWTPQRYRRNVANFTKIVAATDFSEDSSLALS